MDWKINLLITIGVITMISTILGQFAGILNSLVQIAAFFQRMATPMFKNRWIHEGTYPLKVTIKDARPYGFNISTPQILVTFLIEPRKTVLLGECEMIPFPNTDFKGRPDKKGMHDDRAQD